MNIFTPFRSAQERAWSAQPLSPSELRRRRLVGLAWAAVWSFPVLSLADEIVRATDRPWLAAPLFAAYLGLYLYLIMDGFGSRLDFPKVRTQLLLATFAVLGVVLALVYMRVNGGGSLVLMLYVGVAGVSVYPPPVAYFWAIGSVLVLGGIGLYQGERLGEVGSLVLSALLAAALALVVRNMIRLIRELDRTRNELARAAVEQERVRFARDLHDLLGHTLSLIVVKAEVARRLAERDPAAAAREAAEIEQIGRQALAEVREAVTGYRARAFAEELDNARSALGDAGIEATVRLPAGDGDLPPAVDQAFAWVVREAATNVIKHSGARTTRIMVENGSGWSLTVRDDGRGRVDGAAEGNGLRGLRERMALLGGTLAMSDAGGFALCATVPCGEA
jgi:two-component system, NarL family, sensor histidine kinase DesK